MFLIQKLEVLFNQKLSDFRKNFPFWEVPRLWPFVLLVRATCRWRLRRISGMILSEETEELADEQVPVPLLPPQNSSSLTYYRIWTSTLIARQITGWAMEQSKNQHLLGHMALEIGFVARSKYIPCPSLRPVNKCNIETWTSFIGTLANLREKNISFVMSVRPTVLPSFRKSAWNNSDSTGRFFMKFGISVFFLKICQENSNFFKIGQE